MKYAKELKPNSIYIYLQLLCKSEGQIFIQTNRKEIKEWTGIAENKQTEFIEELKSKGLLTELTVDDYGELLSDYLGEDCSDVPIGRYELLFSLEIAWETAIDDGGFIKLPKELIVLKEVELEGKKIKIKPRHIILLILHCILAENKGYSFANLKYLGDTLGLSERQIIRLNNELILVELLKKDQEIIIKGHNDIKKENYYYPCI